MYYKEKLLNARHREKIDEANDSLHDVFLSIFCSKRTWSSFPEGSTSFLPPDFRCRINHTTVRFLTLTRFNLVHDHKSLKVAKLFLELSTLEYGYAYCTWRRVLITSNGVQRNAAGQPNPNNVLD